MPILYLVTKKPLSSLEKVPLMKKIAFILVLLFPLGFPAVAQDISIPRRPAFLETDYWKVYARASAIEDALETLNNPGAKYWNRVNINQLRARIHQNRLDLRDWVQEFHWQNVYESHYVRTARTKQTVDKKKIVRESEKISADIEAQLNTLYRQLDEQLQKASEYLTYTCKLPIPIYIFEKRDYRKFNKYSKFLHKISTAKHKADLSLTPEQWRASLSPEEKKDGRKVLEQLDKIWTRRKSYPIELEIQWEQLTENEYNYLVYELKNEESLEEALEIDLVLVSATTNNKFDRLGLGGLRNPVEFFNPFIIKSTAKEKMELTKFELRDFPKFLDKGIGTDAFVLSEAIKKVNQELEKHPVFGFKNDK